MADHDSRPPLPVDGEASKRDIVAPTKKNATNGTSQNGNGSLYVKSDRNVVMVRRLKRKDMTFKTWFVENQTGLSFNLIALLFLAHLFIPKARLHTPKFFQLSYYNAATEKYGVGFDDIFLISFFIVLFTGLRAGTMEYILAPLGRMQGITQRKTLTRFTEQGWMVIYYIFFWSLGVWLYYNSPAFLNLRELWTAWPDRELSGVMKAYILAQWSFWVQQIIVINIEERRKDYWQMLSHHFITCGLVSSCYCYHHTRVGNLILVLMDIGDIQLGTSKCLKYCGFTTLCDFSFGIFVICWLAFRHVFFMMVCYSIYAHTPEILPTGCFYGTPGNMTGPVAPPVDGWNSYLLEPYFDSAGRVCYNETVKWGFLTPLLMLQVLLLIWLVLILRVVIKVVSGKGAEDNRSDDECEAEDDEDEEFVYEEAELLEEEVGVEALDLKSWEKRHNIKREASSSSVSLPGHSDRKELLGRIGCDKQVD